MTDEVSRNGLARALGLAPTTVSTWIRKYGCPWPLTLDTLEWVLRRKRPHIFASEATATADLEREMLEARLRTERERGEILELDRRHREGELVEIAEIEAQWGAILVRVRQRTLAVAVRAAPLVVGEGREQAQAVLDAELRLALEELSRTEEAAAE